MQMRKYIKKIEIESYNQLIEIIHGKTDFCEDLRGKFVFRGMDNDAHELIPSSLRNNNKLNNYVDEDFKITLCLFYEKAVEYGFIEEEEKYDNVKYFTINKYNELLKTEYLNPVSSYDEVQFRKEIHVLMKFLDYGDKVGLKIPISQETRELIEHDIKKRFKEESIWPDPEFYELISLAQHYGIPTRALDWSYDYNVSLYFTVKNLLKKEYNFNEKPKNGILWAFNYKYFDINGLILQKNAFATDYYRPEYNSNPNLNAQKGLFTFIINELNHITRKPFEQFIEKLLYTFNDSASPNGRRNRILPKNEYAFYKFIIPEEIKPNILNELYLEGYSEEYLFTGYNGVTNAIENRIKLDKILKNQKIIEKKNILLKFKQKDIDKIKSHEKTCEFRKYDFIEPINNIFIYSNNEIFGYFKGNSIMKNTPEKLWNQIGEFSGLTDEEFIKNFKNKKECYAIDISCPNIFDNPIKLHNFKEPANYYYIENREELKFLLNFM